MQVPKLKVRVEAGVVRAAVASYAADAGGWTVRVAYVTHGGERCEALDRQRGGARVFATLDAVARALAGLGLAQFQVEAAGLQGEEPP